jgi:hypothetical protein
VALHQLLGEPCDVLGLLSEHPDAVQGLLYLRQIGRAERRGRRPTPKQAGCDLVDGHVRCLCAEHGGNQKLERVLV